MGCDAERPRRWAGAVNGKLKFNAGAAGHSGSPGSRPARGCRLAAAAVFAFATLISTRARGPGPPGNPTEGRALAKILRVDAKGKVESILGRIPEGFGRHIGPTFPRFLSPAGWTFFAARNWLQV